MNKLIKVVVLALVVAHLAGCGTILHYADKDRAERIKRGEE